MMLILRAKVTAMIATSTEGASAAAALNKELGLLNIRITKERNTPESQDQQEAAASPKHKEAETSTQQMR